SQYRTSNKYVYAVGDVSQRLKFTHTADDIARQVVLRVASHGWFRVNSNKSVPKVTYTEPEIAQVGMSWRDATQKYNESEVTRIEVSYDEHDRAKTDSQTNGTLVVIARRLNGAVLGAHIIGPHAGELISLFTLAIDQRISMWKLQSIIYAYPTYALLIRKAGDKFIAEQLANLKSDLWYVTKKHLPKIIALIFWGSLIYAFNDYRVSQGLSNTDLAFQLVDFFTNTIYGPLIYIVLYAIRPIIFFPATLLTALSGVLFGLWWGILYTIIGENASANFAYWIGRFFGKGLKLEDSFIGNWVEGLRKNAFETILFMRLAFFPFDFTNYAAGIIKVNWRQYFLATLIGIMPGLTIFVSLGASVDLETLKNDGISFSIFDPTLISVSVAILIGSIILARYLKRWKAQDVA
ncbi:MAG: VTT domain-containing protein, partial [Bacteroidota bacterium]